MPWEAAVAVAHDLCTDSACAAVDFMAAAALMVSFDTYSRPSEALALKGKDICVPTARPDLIAVAIRQQDEEDEG
eukprot:12157821-Heterocapsa_arctica.AAC.1